MRADGRPENPGVVGGVGHNLPPPPGYDRVNRSAKNWGGGSSCPPAPSVFKALELGARQKKTKASEVNLSMCGRPFYSRLLGLTMDHSIIWI